LLKDVENIVEDILEPNTATSSGYSNTRTFSGFLGNATTTHGNAITISNSATSSDIRNFPGRIGNTSATSIIPNITITPPQDVIENLTTTLTTISIHNNSIMTPSSNNVSNQTLGITNHRKTKPKSVSFQLTRANLSNATRARARAQHYQYLIDHDIVPYWTLGLEPAPAYIKDIIPEIIRLKKLQSMEIMQTAVVELTNRAAECENVGRSLKQITLPTLFGNKVAEYRKAVQKIESLVQRDEQECRTQLATRRELLATQQITDEVLSNALLLHDFPNDARRPTNSNPRPRSRSRSPGPRNQFRGSPRGRGYPRGNNRGTSRGRGNPYSSNSTRGNYTAPQRDSRPRGRGRGRGNPGNNSRDRASQSNRPGNTQVSLTQAELNVINAIRNQQQ
jgi:hypothetical protein